jgi:hypothetical protein
LIGIANFKELQKFVACCGRAKSSTMSHRKSGILALSNDRTNDQKHRYRHCGVDTFITGSEIRENVGMTIGSHRLPVQLQS